jgi:hypothetical protein
VKAAEYAPATPLDTRPPGTYVHPGQRHAAVLDALDGVTLGAYDRRIVDWLSGCDDDTCRAVVSLLLRTRAAGGAS